MRELLANGTGWERFVSGEPESTDRPFEHVSIGAVLRAFVRTVDAKDPYTREHSERVANYATAIAREFGFDARAEERIRWAALLHDIGKIAVPDEVLRKSGRLSPEEWALMHRHPLESVRILIDIPVFEQCLPAIRHHHERLDGWGYPDRLDDREIPFGARILSVADAFDAMTSPRAYRLAMTEAAALRELEAGMGSQFDAEVVQAFLALFGERCALATAPAPTPAREDIVTAERPVVAPAGTGRSDDASSG